VNFEIYLDCLESLKYDVIEWCIDVLNYVCNEVKVWSRHTISRKGNIVLRLLLRCIELWVSCEWDNPDSTNIMESHRWSYSVGESRKRIIWLSLRFKDLIRANQMDLPWHMRWWDVEIDYAHECVDSQWVVWQVQVSGC